jgi:hypothetical protein
MPVSQTNALERVARVLAAERLSDNGEGVETSAGAHIDQVWPEYLEEAAAVLKTLREPDPEMAAAGDADMWERMVRAALRRRGNGPMPN